jgi:hypothetical protein
LLEALCFTSGVPICSSNRVTFRKIHNAGFTIAIARAFIPERAESDVRRDRGDLRGYRFMDGSGGSDFAKDDAGKPRHSAW